MTKPQYYHCWADIFSIVHLRYWASVICPNNLAGFRSFLNVFCSEFHTISLFTFIFQISKYLPLPPLLVIQPYIIFQLDLWNTSHLPSVFSVAPLIYFTQWRQRFPNNNSTWIIPLLTRVLQLLPIILNNKVRIFSKGKQVLSDLKFICLFLIWF